jgi:hypothetical protein
MTSMTKAILRSIAVAALTGIVLFGATWIDFVALCSPHQAWVRRQSGASRVIRSDGMMVALPGDAIYSCTTEHCFIGTVDCHVDLSCYCAPAAMSAQALGRLIGGSCTIDQPQPARTDVEGACLHAVCDEHVPRPR